MLEGHVENYGRIMDLEGPGIQMFQLDSSVGRARSRSREPDF